MKRKSNYTFMIFFKNTKHTLLARKSRQNKTQQAEIDLGNQRVSVAYKYSLLSQQPWPQRDIKLPLQQLVWNSAALTSGHRAQ